MSRTLQVVVLLIVAALGLAGGIAYRYYTTDTPPPAAPTTDAALPGGQARTGITSTMVGKPRPDYHLQDLNDQTRSAADYDGQVVVVNFWATWCPPCVKEMPALEELYETYRDRNLVVVGIALDTMDDVVQFVDPLGIEYPILIGEEDGIEISQDYGNRLGVLPFTVIIDRDGVIRHVHPGEISLEDVRAYIEPLL